MSDETIVDTLTAVMAGIGVIGKDRKNRQQGFNFRGIDDVQNALQPELIKHGLVVAPSVTRRTDSEVVSAKGAKGWRVTLEVEFTFMNKHGATLTATTHGEAMDYADKATNKAMSAAFKYALFQTLCIPTEDQAADDVDNHSPEARASQGGARSGAGVETGEAATEAQQRKYGVEARLLTEHLGEEGFQEFVKAHYGAKKLPKAKPADLTKKQLSTLIDTLVHKREGCEIEAAVTPDDFEGIYDDRKKQDE